MELTVLCFREWDCEPRLMSIRWFRDEGYYVKVNPIRAGEGAYFRVNEKFNFQARIGRPG